MIDKVKLIAMYLPQYHEILENNEFWGQGFTDWTAVKSAKQYFIDIRQPKVPLNGNFYDLSKPENIKWQVNLAKNYGIDGFCMTYLITVFLSTTLCGKGVREIASMIRRRR